MCAGNDFIRRPVSKSGCLGIAPGIGRRNEAEREAGMSPESLFYLPCDGEIQINSCQSGGPQGEGL